MGISQSKFAGLPSQPNLFHVDSKVKVVIVTSENLTQPLPYTCGKVVKTYNGGFTYDVEMEGGGGVHIKVPYFLIFFPKEEPRWEDYFLEKHRVVMIKNDKKCIIRSVATTSMALALQEVANTEQMHFHVQPNEVMLDMDYYKC